MYCIPVRSLATVAELTAVFSENRKFTTVDGLYSDCTDAEAGQLKEFSPLGRSFRNVRHG